MKTVTIHQAKTHLSRLIREALDGEEIVIARRDKPLVKLVPLESSSRERKIGTAKAAAGSALIPSICRAFRVSEAARAGTASALYSRATAAR